MNNNWKTYNGSKAGDFYDELITDTGGPRQAARQAVKLLQELSSEDMAARRGAAELAIREMGISFTIYSEGKNIDRAWPFDIIPRIIPAKEWQKVSHGLAQRSRALNCFIDDIYNRQRILADGLLPADIVLDSGNYKPQCAGVSPRFGTWAHICGTDLVRDRDGKFYVLEDNLRVPSGVSYMLENREITKRVLPELFENYSILPVDDYPSQLYSILASLSPRALRRPCIAVLTPGIFNSAYFEHSFLADQMGVELVEGHDLRVIDGRIAMRTTRGYKPVDVMYRRVDDDFLDPLVFNPKSMLGVPGIMDVYRSGGITIANAPGTGIADDKAIYSYMPDIVEFYTGEKPLLPNVETWRCSEPDALSYVLEHLDELVVKEVHGSGGYGMLVGPAASRREIADFRKKLQAKPGNYIAQPTLALSTAPILTSKGLAPRHLDLRPFVLVSSEKITITPGGLTRVALKKGSLVVNSSQGGGTKDTWVLGD